MQLGIMTWARAAAILLMATFLGGVAAWATTTDDAPVYESSVRLLIGPVAGDTGAIRSGELLTATYARLVTTSLVLERGLELTGEERAIEELRNGVTAVGDDNTRLLQIRVRDRDLDFSVALADGLATALVDVAQPEPGTPTLPMTLVDRQDALGPLPSRTGLVTMLGMVGGGAFGIGLIVLLGAVQRRMPEDWDEPEPTRSPFEMYWGTVVPEDDDVSPISQTHP
jgi:capsular polysaccharide biosynthesis protein